MSCNDLSRAASIVRCPIALLFALLCSLPPSTAAAQGDSSKAMSPLGTVTGHVLLEDIGGPARFASVVLQPVLHPREGHDADDQDQRTSKIVHTQLDGSFAIQDVPAGNYYVIADSPGYVAASGVLTQDQIDHPTKALMEEMRRLLVPVSVAAGKTSKADVTLHRGAALSGAVRFDDGSPFANATVTLLRQDLKGEWQPININLLSSRTSVDDTGHFRLSGLGAGAYRLSVKLSMDDDYLLGGLDSPQGWSDVVLYAIDVFYPAATREKDARTINLKSGEDISGLDIEIPLSKLHSISGALVLKGTARPINSGHISLTFADDHKELAGFHVAADDGSFYLPFVPEGSYELNVTNAKEVSRTAVANPPGSVPPFKTTTETLHSFGTATQSLIVTSDAQGILVAVPLSSDSNLKAPATQGANTP